MKALETIDLELLRLLRIAESETLRLFSKRQNISPVDRLNIDFGTDSFLPPEDCETDNSKPTTYSDF